MVTWHNRQPVVINSGHLKKHMQHRTHDPVWTQAKHHIQLKQWVNGDIATGSIIEYCRKGQNW
jgi:hypothetical protein